jgi:hypothetical protein
MKEILKQKTTWTGIVAIVTAIGGYYTGGLASADAIEIMITGLIGIFLRQGIAKGK